MQKQLTFPQFIAAGRKEFGGSLLKGHPRVARPVATKKPMHLVLRSTLAMGEFSFLHVRRKKEIYALTHRLAKKKGVKLYRYANSGNHLHLLILPRSRDALNQFLRALCGIMARLVLGAERGKAKKIQFWDARPYTRVLEWGREFRTVSRYLLKNTLPALGFALLPAFLSSG